MQTLLVWKEETMETYRYCPLCASELQEKTIDGAKRRACSSESCSFIYWNNPLPVVAALIEHEGKVLLARNATWPEKVFGLVTGFLEAGESPEKGIIREVKEELNLEAKIEGLIGLYNHEGANQLIIAYHVTAEGTVSLGDEIAETRHVPREKLRPWPFGTGLAVRDWLEK